MTKKVGLAQRLRDYGSDRYEGASARKFNSLSNQALLSNVYVALGAMLLTAGLVISLHKGWLAAEGTDPFQMGKDYIIPQLIYFTGLLLSYFVKNRFAINLAGSVFWSTWTVAYITLMALLTGPDTGIYLIILAYVPIPLLMEIEDDTTRRVYTIFNTLITLAMFAIAREATALSPLPAAVSAVILKVTVPLFWASAGLLIIFFMWKFEWAPKVLAIWKNWAARGSEYQISEEDARATIIYNNVLITFLVISLGTALTNIGWSYASYQVNPSTWFYILMYPAIGFAASLLLFVVYRVKIHRTQTLGLEIFSYLSGLVYVTLMVYLLGVGSSFHYPLIGLAPVPLFFTTRSWLIKIGYALIAPAAFVAVFLYGNVVPAPHPLPAEVGEPLSWLIKAVIGSTLIILFAYIWWKYEFTAKLLRMWRGVSEYGNHKYDTISDRKINVLTNQLFLLFCGTFTITAIGVVIFSLMLMRVDAVKYGNYMWIYLGLTGCGMVMLVGSFILKQATARLGFANWAFTVGVAYIVAFSLFVGRSGGFHLFLFVLIPIPFFAIPSHKRLQRLYGSVLVLGGMIFTLWWHDRYVALFPTPESIGTLLFYTMLVASVIAMLFSFYYLWNETDLVENEMIRERNESDRLLLNILPTQVAEELKETGATTPVNYDSASVLFTGFSDFALFSKSLTARTLISELDLCFGYFDSVTEQFQLEKLKTIGDSFMAAGGIPVSNGTHAIDCVLAALAMRAFIQDLGSSRDTIAGSYWGLKVGIHTGPLAAGVVGESKFAYDVWGDTVNTASRMEEAAEAGSINISVNTHSQLKDLFDCEPRGQVEVKHKGEVDMYFVKGITPQYAADSENTRPNDAFWMRYND